MTQLAAAMMAPLADRADDAAAPTVRLRGLVQRYGTHKVLDGLDWALQPGQVVGLLGRNGAGKTTLLETLLGLREPQAGEARLFGCDAFSLGDAERARIGYVPQASELFEWLTPAQLLQYFRSFYPRWNEAKVEGLMSRWAIERDKPIGRLSGGQKQRLSIVRALAHDPDLLVLDEPVSGLDPAGRRDFLRELVDQVIERGTTVVFSTHILSDLERVAFNVAFLTGGRIALQAPLDELLDGTRQVQGTPADLEVLCRTHRLQVLSRGGDARHGRWLVRVAEGQEAPPRAERVTLEDLFLELTR